MNSTKLPTHYRITGHQLVGTVRPMLEPYSQTNRDLNSPLIKTDHNGSTVTLFQDECGRIIRDPTEGPAVHIAHQDGSESHYFYAGRNKDFKYKGTTCDCLAFHMDKNGNITCVEALWPQVGDASHALPQHMQCVETFSASHLRFLGVMHPAWIVSRTTREDINNNIEYRVSASRKLNYWRREIARSLFHKQPL